MKKDLGRRKSQQTQLSGSKRVQLATRALGLGPANEKPPRLNVVCCLNSDDHECAADQQSKAFQVQYHWQASAPDTWLHMTQPWYRHPTIPVLPPTPILSG